MENEIRLNELPWDKQLEHVIKAYHKGLITYPEYIFKQYEKLQQALMQGVSFETINKFEAW